MYAETACEFEHEKSILIKARLEDSQSVIGVRGSTLGRMWAALSRMKNSITRLQPHIIKHLQKVFSVQTACLSWVSLTSIFSLHICHLKTRIQTKFLLINVFKTQQKSL